VGPEGFEPSIFGFLRSRNSSSPRGSVKLLVISGAQRLTRLDHGPAKDTAPFFTI
jgi:hypothetical protein